MTCPICAKHRGEGDLVGPVVWRDDLVVVSHRPVDDTGTAVESRPDHVFSVVAGRGVAHFHQHVYARHAGTPDDVPLFAPVPSGVRWAARQVDDLVTRLRAHFP